MFVYGDAHSDEPIGVFIQRLHDSAALLIDAPIVVLDPLRAMLIRAGQLEQAAHDAGNIETDPFHHITACAARAFYARWANLHDAPTVRRALRDLLDTMNTLQADGQQIVTVKTPEGFAYYALYPEQFLLAVQEWMTANAAERDRPVIVVGVRSIGTTLAALVTVALETAEWRVQSFTVRPTGHPFDRRVTLTNAEQRHISPSVLALIVDEGPGFSGSSMASAAEALAKAGVRRENISFLPGHGNDPLGAGGDWVGAWWATAGRYVGSLHDVRFDGLTLQEALKAAAQVFHPQDPVQSIETFSGGAWRRAAYRSPDEYPPVCASFERVKYAVMLQSGRRVLWKFAGLSAAPNSGFSIAEADAALMNQRAEMGSGIPVLGTAHGFIAMRWIEGDRLTSTDASPGILMQIGQYISATACDALSDDEQAAGQTRLRGMLYWNSKELLGEAWAMIAQRNWGEVNAPLIAYGDGHLAPHEWIRDQSGKLWKADSIGHDCDHTLIGKQSVIWDIAGLLVEWDLDGGMMPFTYPALFSSLPSEWHIDSHALAFYRASYAAFRGGMCEMCAEQDADEAPGLRRAVDRYCAELQNAITEGSLKK